MEIDVLRYILEKKLCDPHDFLDNITNGISKINNSIDNAGTKVANKILNDKKKQKHYQH